WWTCWRPRRQKRPRRACSPRAPEPWRRANASYSSDSFLFSAGRIDRSCRTGPIDEPGRGFVVVSRRAVRARSEDSCKLFQRRVRTVRGSRSGREQLAEARRSAAERAPHRAGQVRVIGEAELGRQAREPRLALCQPLQDRPDPDAVAVARDRLAGLEPEDPAEMVRRDGGLPGE